jgi:hypothetical protein
VVLIGERLKTIKILFPCNVAGKPAVTGDVLTVEDTAAGYVISIGKAEEVVETPPQIDPAKDGGAGEPTLERGKTIERKSAPRKPAAFEEPA